MKSLMFYETKEQKKKEQENIINGENSNKKKKKRSKNRICFLFCNVVVFGKFYPEKGYFVCKGCGNPLYSHKAKFNSGCGWPAFDQCLFPIEEH